MKIKGYEIKSKKDLDELEQSGMLGNRYNYYLQKLELEEEKNEEEKTFAEKYLEKCEQYHRLCDVKTELHIENEKLKQQLTQLTKDNLNSKKVFKLIDGCNCSLCGASQADIRKKYSSYCSNCGAKINEFKERY